jgi:MFS family permease
VVLSLAMPFFRPAEDSSYFTNLGGQRLRERGLLPYGDPMLTNTPGAAYAPLMYAAQAGMQALLREPTNKTSPDLPVLGAHSEYNLPSPVSSLILLAGFQLLAAWALFMVGRQWGGDHLGLAFAALYSGSAAVLGVGGSGDQIGGMTFVSHIIPPALMITAFLYLERPIRSGVLLAAAAAAGFYPAFTFPVWLGYQWGRSPKSALQFVIGFGALSLVVGLWVLWASRPADGLGLVGTILRDTLGHQTNPQGYGMAPFGLWGQQTGFLQWMIQPLVGASPMTSPGFLLYFSFLVATAIMARNAGPAGLALLTATAAMGANLWRIPGTGSYMNWYYPFLLIGALAPGIFVRRPAPEAGDRRHAA